MSIKDIKIQSKTNFAQVTETSDETLYFVERDDLLTTADKATIAKWGLPDYNNKVSISGMPYTVTANGWVYAHGYTGDNDGGFNVNGNAIIRHKSSQYGGIGTTIGGMFPVSAGDVIAVSGLNFWDGYFCPMKGGN